MLLSIFDDDRYLFKDLVSLSNVLGSFFIFEVVLFQNIDETRELHHVDFDHVIRHKLLCFDIQFLLSQIQASTFLTDLHAFK